MIVLKQKNGNLPVNLSFSWSAALQVCSALPVECIIAADCLCDGGSKLCSCRRRWATRELAYSA